MSTGPGIVAGETSLFETRGGAYFLVREVKEGVSADPDYIGGQSFCLINNPGLHPLTRKQALAWAESKELDADKIESMFGKIAEAGEKTGSMLLRLPKTLKAAIDQAAGAAGRSSNAWAMRCLESCVNNTTGRMAQSSGRRSPMQSSRLSDCRMSGARRATRKTCGSCSKL